MTISSSNRKAGPFTGNGVTTAFPFTFKVFTAADVLAVLAVTATGAETTQILTTNYTVTLNADQNANPGGTLTMLVPPATGRTLTLTSQVAPTQAVDLQNAGGFYPSVINTALDKATILIQQLTEKVSRAVTVSISSGADPATVITSLAAQADAANSSASAASSSASAAATSAAAAAASAASVDASAITAKTSSTGSSVIPTGTTAQRDAAPAKGYLRYNSTTDTFEGYSGATPAWGAIAGSSSGGGATGAGTDQVFYENDKLATGSYTIGNAAINIACTFANGSAVVTAANTLVADQPVRFNTAGTLPTNFSTSAFYYVISTGLSSSAFQVSSTIGGAAIVAGSAGTGTHTVGKVKDVMVNRVLAVATGQTITFPTGVVTQVVGGGTPGATDLYVSTVTNQTVGGNKTYTGTAAFNGAATFSAASTFGSAPMPTPTGAAPVFGARAWVNFVGSTGAINASGNVTSVTRNGVGDYTVNFTTAMPDANYSVSVGVVSSSSINQIMGTVGSQLAGSYRFTTVNAGVSAVDAPSTMVTFFR